MSVSESDRRDIFVGLERAIGDDAANNLMKLLPYQPAEQLVTRADMHAQTLMLRGEMAELRAETAELRAEVKSDIADLKIYTQRWMSGVVAANAVAVVTALLT